MGTECVRATGSLVGQWNAVTKIKRREMVWEREADMAALSCCRQLHFLLRLLRAITFFVVHLPNFLSPSQMPKTCSSTLRDGNSPILSDRSSLGHIVTLYYGSKCTRCTLFQSCNPSTIGVGGDSCISPMPGVEAGASNAYSRWLRSLLRHLLRIRYFILKLLDEPPHFGAVWILARRWRAASEGLVGGRVWSGRAAFRGWWLRARCGRVALSRANVYLVDLNSKHGNTLVARWGALASIFFAFYRCVRSIGPWTIYRSKLDVHNIETLQSLLPLGLSYSNRFSLLLFIPFLVNYFGTELSDIKSVCSRRWDTTAWHFTSCSTRVNVALSGCSSSTIARRMVARSSPSGIGWVNGCPWLRHFFGVWLGSFTWTIAIQRALILLNWGDANEQSTCHDDDDENVVAALAHRPLREIRCKAYERLNLSPNGKFFYRVLRDASAKSVFASINSRISKWKVLRKLPFYSM